MIESSRRSFITGLVAFVAAPAIVRASNIMPVKADRRFIDIYNGVPIWEGDNISAEVYGRSPMMDVLPNFKVFLNPNEHKWFKLQNALPSNAVLVEPIPTDLWQGFPGR